ncbi:MAG: polysaccharide deacetylase family protein [Bacilli bacterium]
MLRHLKRILLLGFSLCIVVFTVGYFVQSTKASSLAEKSFQTIKQQDKEQRYDVPEEWNGERAKIAYLTFDDGPSKYTEEIIRILNEYNARASFFVVGDMVERFPDEVRKMAEAGNYVGLHSMTHDYNKLYGKADGSGFIKEMTTLRTRVEQLTGSDANLIRPPYGSSPGIKPAFIPKIIANDFKVWDWSIDSNDWRHAKNPNKIVSETVSQLRKDVEVILVHEREQTVKVLPKLIQALQKRGYVLLPYDESMHTPVNLLNNKDI